MSQVFNDEFWEGLDVVVNALDNVNARMYVDSRCAPVATLCIKVPLLLFVVAFLSALLLFHTVEVCHHHSYRPQQASSLRAQNPCPSKCLLGFTDAK